MELFDRTFLTLFARSRRTLGDSQIASAWQAAMTKLGGYLVFPVISLMIFAMLLKHVFLDPQGYPVEKLPGQLIGIVIFIAFYAALYRRYRVYSSQPPTLTPTESEDDGNRLSRFRITVIGLFVLMLLLSVFVRLGGF